MAFVGYFTVGLRYSLCPDDRSGFNVPLFDGSRVRSGEEVRIQGYLYQQDELNNALKSSGQSLSLDWIGEDITRAFNQPACNKWLTTNECFLANRIPGSPSFPLNNQCLSPSLLKSVKKAGRLNMEWPDLKAQARAPHHLIVFNNAVVNLTLFFTEANSNLRVSNDMIKALQNHLGRDGTYFFSNSADKRELMNCLVQRYTVASIGGETLGCAVYGILTTVALVVVLGLILVRFFMALIFHWFIAPKQVKNNRSKMTYLSREYQEQLTQNLVRSVPTASDLHTICLVTCYSEGPSAIRNTLDSLAATTYPDERKLLFVICDGLITGQGNMKSTPDIVIDLIQPDETFGEPQPCSYLAIADGTKQHNMAYVVICVKLVCWNLSLSTKIYSNRGSGQVWDTSRA